MEHPKTEASRHADRYSSPPTHPPPPSRDPAQSLCFIFLSCFQRDFDFDRFLHSRGLVLAEFDNLLNQQALLDLFGHGEERGSRG